MKLFTKHKAQLMLVIITLVFFCCLLTGCSGNKKSDQLTIAVIPKGTTHEFWKSIHAGTIKAQRELQEKGMKIEIIWKGPLKEDDREQQIQVVENFVARGVSGIVLAPLDDQALVAPVEASAGAKIPVVIIDSELKTENRVSFVATDNYKGGYQAGEHLGKLLNGRGNVLMLRYQVGSASTNAREAGFLDAMKEKYPNIKLISTEQYGGATRETAYKAAQNLLNQYNKQINGIFTPNESVTIGMLLALRDINKAGGKIQFVGFDAGTQSVEALGKGEIQGLVVQNPMRMGYEGIMTIVNHLKGIQVPKRLDTGVVLVTKENMEFPEIKELLYPPLEKYLQQ